MKNILKKLKRFSRRSILLPFVIVAILVIGMGFFLVKGMMDQVTVGTADSSSDTRIAVEKPVAQQVINKVLYFPLKDADGNEVAKLRYEILGSELREQIIVKGQKATAIKGRLFLIVTIKIVNDYKKPLELRARDYVRLVVNGTEEKLAPEIHNDPVEVQALSTKYTRIGFPINDSAKNIKLLVGEIGGKKEEIKLQFR